ncbi:MAG: DUF2971 domain-containing protein [Candidatus Cloacimonetes bacterium]|nr:DUF2971 domain-containing protein [Candidatus Cloacimonadota bacterium]
MNDKAKLLWDILQENYCNLLQQNKIGNIQHGLTLPILYDYSIEELFHYTNLPTLFDMLESDSIWLSGLRFSNDESDETILGKNWLYEHNYIGDNFIFCLTKEKDRLSQWRGYCQNGGASIGFDMFHIAEYSVLHSDSDITKKHKDVIAIPLPVLYADNEREAKAIIAKIDELICKQSSKYSQDINIYDFVPYIKNSAFAEEQEFRLKMSNTNNELSNCIRFRKLFNGTRLPYIVIKSGCIDETHDNFIDCSSNNIKSIVDSRTHDGHIIIPTCANQSDLYFNVRNYIKEKNEMTLNNSKIKIFCSGHLPIRSIKIAPMSQQSRTKEIVNRFCQSKYWLKDVEVTISDIPFVPSINIQ